MYGDVVRVKILFNKKDTALIQFNHAQQAQTGMFMKQASSPPAEENTPATLSPKACLCAELHKGIEVVL